MDICLRFSSHSDLLSSVLIRSISLTNPWARSSDQFDCGWNAVVFMCLILKAFSNESINLQTKFRPWSVSMCLGDENVYTYCSINSFITVSALWLDKGMRIRYLVKESWMERMNWLPLRVNFNSPIMSSAILSLGFLACLVWVLLLWVVFVSVC